MSSDRLASGLVFERWQVSGLGDDVPALMVRPEADGPVPLLLYPHAHGHRYEVGKEEILQGRPALQDPPLGLALAEAGYAVLSWDAIGFGERMPPENDPGGAERAWAKACLWRGFSPWGRMLADGLAVLDAAAGHEAIDSGRTGVVGFSMGALAALWLAALEPRFRVCVELCCLADIETLIEAGAHDLHAHYFMVPGFLTWGDSADLCRLVAPRAHLVCAGALDPLTPPASLRRIEKMMTEVYANVSLAESWRLLVEPEHGHGETPFQRRTTLDFLKTHLPV
ncbi:MAG: alpha/beta hydrolase family protein [Geminicoccaceae bacterium]